MIIVTTMLNYAFLILRTVNTLFCYTVQYQITILELRSNTLYSSNMYFIFVNGTSTYDNCNSILIFQVQAQ